MKSITLFIILGAVLLSIISYRIGEIKGFCKGVDFGAGAILDTVNKITQSALKSDTSVTELVLINPDTNIYILSRKTPLEKK